MQRIRPRRERCQHDVVAISNCRGIRTRVERSLGDPCQNVIRCQGEAETWRLHSIVGVFRNGKDCLDPVAICYVGLQGVGCVNELDDIGAQVVHCRWLPILARTAPCSSFQPRTFGVKKREKECYVAWNSTAMTRDGRSRLEVVLKERTA